jgi:hypothetical protein
MKPHFYRWIRTSPWPTREFPGLETGNPGLSDTDMVEHGDRIVAGQTSRAGGIKAAGGRTNMQALEVSKTDGPGPAYKVRSLTK